MTARVLGIDLSLTATGLAGPDWTRTLKPPAKLAGVARIDWILSQIDDQLVRDGYLDLAVIEGPAFSRQAGQAGHHERAGLWWAVARELDHDDVPYAVVSPTALKRYATGKGNASKADVIREVARRFPWFEGDDNAADALVLAAMGAEHLGQPLTTMPATHRAALAAVAWPELTSAGYIQEAPDAG